MAGTNEPTKTGTCLYCGQIGPITDDHVPPKGIFAKPLPDNLITVPACKDCNGSFSQDDEYFRQKLVLNVEVYDHPDTKQIADRVFRSFQRPQAKGMTTAFFRDIRPVEVVTQSGIFVENSAAYDVDLHRIAAVVERTARGLLFHETKLTLPDDYDIRILCNEFLKEESPEFVRNLQERIVIPLMKMPAKVIGNGVFRYRCMMTDKPPASVWELTFFEKVPYVAMIGPKRPPDWSPKAK